MKTKKYSKGFTLVELLVVIAIIAILASVILVSLSSQRKNARMSKALQTTNSMLAVVSACYMQGSFSGSSGLGLIAGSTICASNPIKAPALPATCATNNQWFIYEENYSGLSGTLMYYCAGSPDGTIYVRCCYKGTESGRCRVAEAYADTAVNCN